MARLRITRELYKECFQNLAPSFGVFSQRPTPHVQVLAILAFLNELANSKLNQLKKQQIAHLALVVADYDEAIEFYTQKLNFVLLEDTPLSETKRWVRVAPQGTTGCCLLLAKAVGEEQRSRVGNQTGGRVFLFLDTDDFWTGLSPNAGQRHNICTRAFRRSVRHCGCF